MTAPFCGLVIDIVGLVLSKIAGVGVGAFVTDGTVVGTGDTDGDLVGVIDIVGIAPDETEIYAGLAEERTFSEYPSPGPIEKTCVDEPNVTDVGVFVSLIALNLTVATIDGVFIARFTSGPILRTTCIRPGVITGPSRTVGKTVLSGTIAVSGAGSSLVAS